MTYFKNNLEEIWNQEYKDFMLSFYPESSPLVSTWEIYRMAKIKSQRGIESIRTQLLAQCKISRELLVEKEQLEQELQKTREHLGKAIKSAEFFMSHADCKRVSWACKCSFCRDTESSKNLREARQYFQDKDKQGESR